jgi:glycosyltransferase involved in cell wall biosynthesis
MSKVLIISSGYNRFGGTPAKLKKIIDDSKHNYFIYFPLFKKTNEHIYVTNKNWFLLTKGKLKIYEGFYGRNLFAHLLSIHKIIKKEKINIIHAFFDFDTLIAALYKKIFNQNVFIFRSFEGCINKNLSYLVKIILSYLYVFVDHRIYISRYVKEQYEIAFPKMKNKKNSIIYNSPINITKEPVTYENRSNLVCISGLNPVKNIEILIECMNIIINERKKDFKLFILGDGPLKNELQQIVSKYSIEKYVIFVGYTANVCEYLKNCAIYLHSCKKEGFGISVVEAMYFGCPTIVANTGALPELVEDGITGYTVSSNPKEWANKICELMDNIILRKNMSVAAIKRVEILFNENLFIEKHDLLYN